MITLPNTDLQVYPLCLGGNVFGFSILITMQSAPKKEKKAAPAQTKEQKK